MLEPPPNRRGGGNEARPNDGLAASDDCSLSGKSPPVERNLVEFAATLHPDLAAAGNRLQNRRAGPGLGRRVKVPPHRPEPPIARVHPNHNWSAFPSKSTGRSWPIREDIIG